MVSEGMKLELTDFSNAVADLRETLRVTREESVTLPHLKNIFRAASIQSFEVLFDFSLMMMKRYFEVLSIHANDPDKDVFAGLIRMSNVAALINEDIVAWREFREERNKSSHTYE
jgi:nucleotidyltransferase substrate binding protein (TIGR01987 family)